MPRGDLTGSGTALENGLRYLIEGNYTMAFKQGNG